MTLTRYRVGELQADPAMGAFSVEVVDSEDHVHQDPRGDSLCLVLASSAQEALRKAQALTDLLNRHAGEDPRLEALA